MPSKLNQVIATSLKKIILPDPNSHKGQNGKLLIIGGSELFHAASKWSLDIASQFVDMVFYSSVPQNNKLIKEAKQNFWNGIVIPRRQLENYIKEADCILIGPGMERQSGVKKTIFSKFFKRNKYPKPKNYYDWNKNTALITNYLLNKYPHKKWVIDAGALQMIDPQLLNSNCIITPHQQELEILIKKIGFKNRINYQKNDSLYQKILHNNSNTISKILNNSTVLVKGPTDLIITPHEFIKIKGGNAGMTKGGTGDVLAGLIAALYCKNDIKTASIVASYLNKKAGEELFEKQGPFFNASDLVTIIPQTLAKLVA